MVPYTKVFEEIKNYFYHSNHTKQIHPNLRNDTYENIVSSSELDFEIEDLENGSIYIVFNRSTLNWDNGKFECHIGNVKAMYVYYANCEEHSFNNQDITTIIIFMRPHLDKLAREIEAEYKRMLDEIS